MESRELTHILVSAAKSGCRGTSVLTLPYNAHKGPKSMPLCLDIKASPASTSSLPSPPRLATSVSPTEEPAPVVVTAASPTSIPSSEATTPSPGASSPTPEPEKPPGSLSQPRKRGVGSGEGTSVGSTSELCHQLLSHWAQRSCPRMGSLMQQSSAAAACKSWSPLLPTDTTPVPPLPPLS